MPEITVYGTSTCNDCRRSTRLLDDLEVAYRWINIETDPVATALVLELNHGARVIPTIVFADGSFLAEPSDAELAAKLALSGSSTAQG